MARSEHSHNGHTCDTCVHKHWITDKEWNYSQTGHQPLTLECHITGEHIVRNSHVCKHHPLYNIKCRQDNG